MKKNKTKQNPRDMSIQNLCDAAKAVLRWKVIALESCLRNISNKQPNFTPKSTRARRTNKTQS